MNTTRNHTNETNVTNVANVTSNGKMVPGGFYLNRKTWDLVTVNGKHGQLPTDDVHVKIPALLMLAGAPVLGGTLVMFLPFAGIALFLHALYRKVVPAGAPKPAAKPAPARIG